jgi:hypothetical protein
VSALPKPTQRQGMGQSHHIPSIPWHPLPDASKNAPSYERADPDHAYSREWTGMGDMVKGWMVLLHEVIAPSNYLDRKTVKIFKSLEEGGILRPERKSHP